MLGGPQGKWLGAPITLNLRLLKSEAYELMCSTLAHRNFNLPFSASLLNISRAQGPPYICRKASNVKDKDQNIQQTKRNSEKTELIQGAEKKIKTPNKQTHKQAIINISKWMGRHYIHETGCLKRNNQRIRKDSWKLKIWQPK